MKIRRYNNSKRIMAPTSSKNSTRVTRSVMGAKHKLTVNVRNNLSKVSKLKQNKAKSKPGKGSRVITNVSNPVVATARGKGKGGCRHHHRNLKS